MLPHAYYYVAEIRRQEMLGETRSRCSDGPLAVGKWLIRPPFGRPSLDALRSWFKALSRSARQGTGPSAADQAPQGRHFV
jgi:hypothetical protein